MTKAFFLATQTPLTLLQTLWAGFLPLITLFGTWKLLLKNKWQRKERKKEKKEKRRRNKQKKIKTKQGKNPNKFLLIELRPTWFRKDTYAASL